MPRKKLRTYAAYALMVTVFYVFIHLFILEIFALGWHALHGRTAHLTSPAGAKYDVDVPTLAMAHLDDSGWNLSLFVRTGPLEFGYRIPPTRWGMMTFFAGPVSTTAEEARKAAPVLKEKLGYSRVEVAPRSVAGQELYCFERTMESGKLPMNAHDVLTVNCLPLTDKRGFSATYMGKRAFLPEFYGVLSGVRRVN